MTPAERLAESLRLSVVSVIEGSVPGVSVTPGPERPFAEGDLEFPDAVFAIIGLTGDLRGRLVFHLERAAAAALAGAMMMQEGPVAELDRIALSAITELTNMVTGNALSMEPMEALSVEISPPTLFFGQAVSISSLGASGIVLPFDFGRGAFTVLIALEES